MAFVYGPTFAEMHNPALLPADVRARAAKAAKDAPLDPINIFNITWKDEGGLAHHIVLPKELTGVDANIVVLSGRQFPTGSHKVGAGYSILMEKQLLGEVTPGEHTLVCPSTGNYGIGGAWVGPRMGYRSLVVLPEEMSAERFEKIRGYGAEVIATPGCESNVKEIFDKVWELRRDPKNRILEQFSELGNYRFHYRVTGPSIAELAQSLATRGIGRGHVDEHVLREQAVPGLLGDDPDGQPVPRIRARVAILHEQLASLDVVEHPAMERVEELRLDGPVHLAPPDLVLARGFADDELVVRGTAGVLAGPADERTVGRDQRFPAANGLLVERRHAEIPVHPRDVPDPVGFEARGLLRLSHPAPSLDVHGGYWPAPRDPSRQASRPPEPGDRTGSRERKSTEGDGDGGCAPATPRGARWVRDVRSDV